MDGDVYVVDTAARIRLWPLVLTTHSLTHSLTHSVSDLLSTDWTAYSGRPDVRTSSPLTNCARRYSQPRPANAGEHTDKHSTYNTPGAWERTGRYAALTTPQTVEIGFERNSSSSSSGGGVSRRVGGASDGRTDAGWEQSIVLITVKYPKSSPYARHGIARVGYQFFQKLLLHVFNTGDHRNCERHCSCN